MDEINQFCSIVLEALHEGRRRIGEQSQVVVPTSRLLMIICCAALTTMAKTG